MRKEEREAEEGRGRERGRKGIGKRREEVREE